jgi:ankyrin repeat protein
MQMNDEKLLSAIYENDIPTVSSLISSGSMNLNGKLLPLHHAAGLGRVEIMTLLLDAGADINVVDERHFTACHNTIMYDRFDALKLLVERGANLAVISLEGNSLLSGVVRYSRSEQFAILLLDAGAPIDWVLPFDLFELVTSVAMFKRLSAHNIDLTTMRDLNGGSLCHNVARNVKCEDDLRFLFKVFGNDAVHALDDDGMTPLHWAVSNNNGSAMRVLVEFGAEIDRLDNKGRSSLHNAAANEQSSCVELLLALGADVHCVTNDGIAACHLAAGLPESGFLQNYDVKAGLCALVAAGGNLDQPDNKGETPRMIADGYGFSLPTTVEINAARHRIAKMRLDSVRERAFQICLGLQPLNINALQLCEIMMHSFGAVGSLIAFHQWWNIATMVKHFHDRKQQS